MRIAIATPTLGFRGGLERYAHAFASSLRDEGHELTLLHEGGEGRDAEGYARAFDHVARRGDRAAAARQDVVYVQRARSTDDLADLGGVPVVIAAHDHDHTCARSHRYLPHDRSPCHRTPGVGCVLRGCAIVRRPGERLPSLVDPRALARSTRTLGRHAPFVACSRYVADRLVDAGLAPSRVHVVPPVLPTDRAPLVERPAGVHLLVAAQLVRGKGVDLAIDALARMPDDARLTVVGEGSARGELEALAARRAPGRVHFAGYVEPERMHARYDEASVVLVPSRWPEPFGLVGVEALSRGRPVVASAHGGIPEWLAHGEGGELVAPLDVDALAAAALRLARDPSAGDRALEASRRFDHERSVHALASILERAASGMASAA